MKNNINSWQQEVKAFGVGFSHLFYKSDAPRVRKISR